MQHQVQERSLLDLSIQQRYILLQFRTRKCIIFKKPFPLTATIAVTKNETSATITPFHSISAPVESPICDIADGASPKPIIIIIGPITTGGNNLSIQFLPAILIIIANNM